MSWRKILLAIVVAGTASWMIAQETRTYSKETTVQSSDGTKTVTISGEVVRYEPGQTIVLRDPKSRVVTYTIGPDVVVPAEIQVGRRVTITTEPSAAGSGPAVVTRITTTSVTSDGQTKTTTEKTEMTPSGETRTQTTTVYGTVTAFEPGQSITIVDPNQQTVTYRIDTESQLPKDVLVGKTVTIRTTNISGSPFARTVTITKIKTRKKD